MFEDGRLGDYSRSVFDRCLDVLSFYWSLSDDRRYEEPAFNNEYVSSSSPKGYIPLQEEGFRN